MGWLWSVGSLKFICLFCKQAIYKRLYSAKETYNFKVPTHRSHPIRLVFIWHVSVVPVYIWNICIFVYIYVYIWNMYIHIYIFVSSVCDMTHFCLWHEQMRHNSFICLEDVTYFCVSHLSLVSHSCLTCVSFVSHSCLIRVSFVSHLCLICVSFVSHLCLICVSFVSLICLYLTYLFYTSHLCATCLICLWHDS